MPVTIPDLDSPLATLLGAGLSALNVDIVSPATPDPAVWGEQVRGTLQGLIQRANGQDAPRSSGVFASTTTMVAVDNTTTPTDVLGATITGGFATAGRVIRLRTGGRYRNFSGTTRTFTAALSLGGTVLWQDDSNTQGSADLQTAWSLDVDIYVVAATTVYMVGSLRQHTTNAPDVGLGALTSTHRSDAPIGTNGPVTVPSLASNRVLALTITHSFAHADIELERYGYTVELM